MKGEYKHSIDAKGRLAMPAKLRDELGERFTVTKGLDGCLAVYPEKEWEGLEAVSYTHLDVYKRQGSMLAIYLASYLLTIVL